MSGKSKLIIIISVCVAASILLGYGAMCFACVYGEVKNENAEEPFFSSVLQTFDQMFTENSPSLLFKKVGYMITGKTSGNNVKSGKNGFLFPEKNDTFDHYADFCGEYTMSLEQYEKAKDILEQRSEKYGKDGIDYYFVVIPNSQSVCDGMTPFGEKISENTRVKALEKYMNENSFVKVYTVDEAMKNEDDAYTLYNSTENSVSNVGAYRIYCEIFNLLTETYGKKASCVDMSDKEMLKGESLGKDLAKKLNIEKSIRNISYYYNTDDLHSLYTVKDTENDHYVSSLNEASQKSPLLLQIPYEHERVQLKTFFSATYSSVKICTNQLYCDQTLEKDKPKAVVQIVREDDIDSIFDQITASSYDDESEAPSGEKSAKPTVNAKFFPDRKSITIIGTSVDGSKVTAKASGSTSSVVCEDGLFIVTVKKPDSGSIMLTATEKGKSPSDAVYTDTSGQNSSSRQTIVGSGSRLFYSETVDDFLRNNTFSDQHLKYITTNVNRTLAKIRTATGKKTQLIILSAPNPATVYSDQMPEDLIDQVPDSQSRLEQFNAAMNGISGVTALSITDAMTEAKNTGKLYYQTDTHWTEIGAYYGYRAIIDEIAKTSPSVKPYELSDFEITYTTDKGGDLAEFLKIEKRVSERVPHLSPLYKSTIITEYYKPDTISRPEQTADFLSKSSDRSLPIAYMIRDSYSMQMIPYIGEHFSKLYYEEMWNYEFDFDVLEELKPDYVIMVCAERNVGNLFMK